MTNHIEAMKLALEALEHHTAIKHPQQIHYRDAAITALREAINASDGYVLVPVEPTHEMCDQGAQAIVQWENGCVWPDSWGDTYAKQYRKDAKKAYSAMLAAAPKGGV